MTAAKVLAFNKQLLPRVYMCQGLCVALPVSDMLLDVAHQADQADTEAFVLLDVLVHLEGGGRGHLLSVDVEQV